MKISLQTKPLQIEIDMINGKPYLVGNLDLRGTQITALPDGLTVGGKIYGLKSNNEED